MQSVLPRLAGWLISGLALAVGAQAQAQTLRGGVPEKLPGITFENGTLADNSRDGRILKCVTQATDLNLVWVNYPTARLLKMAAAGDLDMVYPMGFNAERDQSLLRSAYTLKARDFWVFQGSRPNLEDKNTILVAAKLASPQQDFLQQNQYKNISLPNSYESLFKMVETGRIAAIAVPEPVFMDMKPRLTWVPMVETYVERDVGFYFSKTLTPEVVERLNRAIPGCRQ